MYTKAANIISKEAQSRSCQFQIATNQGYIFNYWLEVLRLEYMHVVCSERLFHYLSIPLFLLHGIELRRWSSQYIKLLFMLLVESLVKKRHLKRSEYED